MTLAFLASHSNLILEILLKKNLFFEQFKKFTYHLEYTLNQIVIKQGTIWMQAQQEDISENYMKLSCPAFPHAGQSVWQDNVILGRLQQCCSLKLVVVVWCR